jgi:uncharacterized protein
MINSDTTDCLRIIKKCVNELLPESQVILFGSRARKDSSVSSDYDFLVITKELLVTSKKRFLKAALRKKLASFKIPADILIESEQELSLKKELAGHIVRTALNEGITI